MTTLIKELPTKKVMNVVGYCRISSEEQEKGFGLDVQKRMIRDYIKNNKLIKEWNHNELTDVYEDSGYSGALESRPAFDKLKANIVAGKINHIIISDFDRLFREVKYCLEFIDFLGRYKVTLESLTQSGINVFSHEGRLQLTFLQCFSEYERRKISMRTMGGKLEKCRQGYVINSNVKYGFKIEKSGENLKNKKIVIDEEEARVVKTIFNMFYNENKTQSEIAEYLTLNKIPTRSDTDSRSKTKSRNGYGEWTQERISDILRKEDYIGIAYYGKTRLEYGKTLQLPQEEWIPVSCPSIIEKDVFYGVQNMLEQKINPTRKRSCDFYILSSLIKCPYCSMIYQGYKSGKGNHYYRCRGSKGRKLIVSNPCTNTQISGTLIEKFIWNIIKEIIGNPLKFVKNFEKMIQEKSNVKKYEQEIEEIVRDLDKKKRELTSYIIMKASSQSSDTLELYENLILGHELSIKGLSDKKEELSKLIEGEINNNNLSNVIQRLSKIYSKNLIAIESDKKHKELLIKMLVNKIVTNRDSLEVYLNFSKSNEIINGIDNIDKISFEEVLTDNNKQLIKLIFDKDIIKKYEYHKGKSVFDELL